MELKKFFYYSIDYDNLFGNKSIEKGSVRLPEIGITLGPGEIIGEIGIFSPFKERTTSAVCETDLTVLVLSNQKVLELYYQNPAFGLHLGRVIIQRLLD